MQTSGNAPFPIFEIEEGEFQDLGEHAYGSPPRQSWSQRLRAKISSLLPARRSSSQTFQRLATDEATNSTSSGDPAPSGSFTLRPAGRWCPEEEASWLSRMIFSYAAGLLRLGYSKPLTQDDLWDVGRSDAAAMVSDTFQWSLNSADGKLWKAMWKVHGRQFILAGIVKLIHDIVMFSGPFLLEVLLKHVQKGGSAWTGLGLASALAGAAIIETLTVNYYFHMLMRMCMHLKVALVDTLYRKSLSISSSTASDLGVGSIVNLQSNDAAKLWTLPQYLHMVWSGPFQILVVMGLLVRVIGLVPAMTGLGVTIALIPLSTLVAKRLATLRKKVVALTDARVKLSTEVITGIKAIKLYAWEQPYAERISVLRQQELVEIRKSSLIGIYNNMLWIGGPILISMAAFFAYNLKGYPLTASVAFPALSLFNLLRFPVMMFPQQLMNLVNGKVALDRIQKFLKAEEMDQAPLAPSASPAINIGISQQAAFAWAPSGPPMLKNINLSIPAGRLVLAVGSVGSGKSSLLAAVLGEMHAVSGKVEVKGTTAYTQQDPWIQNATLKENILLGAPFDAERYEAVLTACALRPDIALLPAGDETEIGEKGVNLSGGQRHRVALSRACYANADVYLLDDPLSAVDAHVGRHLFDLCIRGYLSTKTRLLVTHQLQYLPAADEILVLDGGEVIERGSYSELTAKGVDFHQFEVTEAEAENEQINTTDGVAAAVDDVSGSSNNESVQAGSDGVVENNTKESVVEVLSLENIEREEEESGMLGGLQPPVMTMDSAAELHSGGRKEEFSVINLDDEDSTNSVAYGESSGLPPGSRRSNGVSAAVMHANGSALSSPKSPTPTATHLSKRSSKEQSRRTSQDTSTLAVGEKLLPGGQQAQHGRITKAEERAVGQVNRAVYWRYFSAWGPALWIPGFVLTVSLTERGLQAGQNWWLSVWSEATADSQQAEATGSTDSSADVDTWYYMGVYFALGVASLIFQIVKAVALVLGSIEAARTLQASLLNTVLRLPMSFFNSQPTGRLLNRFTKDTESVDTSLSQSVSSFLNCAVSVVWSLVVVIAVSPGVILAILPLAWAYSYIQARYVRTSRELKRLDSLAMSPIFGHFNETLQGLATLRAFRVQQRLMERNGVLLDESDRAYWPAQCVNRWLSVRLEMLGIVVVFGTAIFVSSLLPTSAGLAGLALTSALNLTGLMNWMVRQTTELEVNMNSVERLIEYDTQQQEAPAILPDNRPLPEWPQRGTISVRNLVVRYSKDLDPVLHGISFEVGAMEKIGVAGRTGCGKSTLMMALYRLVEPCGGSIVIDGIDISTIGLFDLRSRLALVPQDPVVFSGTVRSNLDPFGTAGSDGVLWGALTQAGLEPAVRAMPEGLDAPIAESGGNLSTGQRQLLCMARALLRKARILVLDEATSNVDTTTDGLIQTAIATAFKECTVLTIAHRLHTIMNSNRVLVLDAGRVNEFDAPSELMKKSQGAFRRLVDETARQSQH